MLHTAPPHVVSDTYLIIPLFLYFMMFHQLHWLYSAKRKFVCLPGWPIPHIFSFFFPCLVCVKILSVTQTMQFQKLDGNELPTVKGKNGSAHNFNIKYYCSICLEGQRINTKILVYCIHIDSENI